MMRVRQTCPECGRVTEQTVERRFHDGSGYTRCAECAKVIVNMAGGIPARVRA